MFNFFVWLLLQPLFFNAPTSSIGAANDCSCPVVTNLQNTGATANSLSYSWNGSTEAIYYEVWYVRDGGHTSAVSTATLTSYTFNNLLPGDYIFYVRVVCDGGTSGFIGVEDQIEL